MTINTVSVTNNKTIPLLTMGEKYSNGKMFVFLRSYLPHDKGWLFRWIFIMVLPKFFITTALIRILLVVSDGDLQEYQQLDNTIAKYYSHVLRAICGWHIVDRA